MAAADHATQEHFLPPSKAAVFRHLLFSPDLSFIMEAHNGISAKIVEEAGFQGIWASGLAISAALGVRDNNEASWTQVLETLEFMADAASIPIMVDGDTGYGNFNNVRRLVRKLCQRNIAAVCLEDKLFPKTNSFIGTGQPLAKVEEFCGKIKAGKDSQTDDNFCVVARIEALVSGLGLDEALRRAEAYQAAGADGILIHSKAKTADEVLEFSARWDSRCPVIIVPTMYYGTPTDRFRSSGINMIIWANHNLRASIAAMRGVSRQIRDEESLLGVEESLASVQDIFDLTDNRELYDAENFYLEGTTQKLSGIVLAASRGEELGKLTTDRPKCMLDIRGQPLLHRLLSTFRECGLGDLSVVRGYRKESIDIPGINTFDNDAYIDTGEIVSLATARERLTGACIVSYGDILFKRQILEGLLENEGDITLAVDAHWRNPGRGAVNRHRDLISASRSYSGHYLDDENVTLTHIGSACVPEDAQGEWIGLVKLSAKGAERVRAEIDVMSADTSLAKAGLPELFSRLIAADEPVLIHYITGRWLNINDVVDLESAHNFL